MTTNNSSPYEYAKKRHQQFVLWRNLWTVLLYLVGASVVIFVILSIFLYLRETFLGGALTTLGAIISGTAITWIIKRQKEAIEAEEAAYKEVITISERISNNRIL